MEHMIDIFLREYKGDKTDLWGTLNAFWDYLKEKEYDRMESDLLEAKNRKEDLSYELLAVMTLGVDKWLNDKELRMEPAQRAAAAREVALKAIESETTRADANYAKLKFTTAKLLELDGELQKYKANANHSICVWCSQVGPRTGEFIIDHAFVCKNNPLHALLELFQKMEPLWITHSFLTPEGERQPADAVGMALVDLLPHLTTFSEAAADKRSLVAQQNVHTAILEGKYTDATPIEDSKGKKSPASGTEMYDGNGNRVSEEVAAEITRRRMEHADEVARDLFSKLNEEPK